MTPRERIIQKEQLELYKRQRQLSKLTNIAALPIFVLVLLLLAAFVDEIATATTGQVQSSVITEFIVRPQKIDYNEGVAIFSGMSVFAGVTYVLAPFYKTLADKLGRKPFLVINVAGMGLGMLLCLWSPNIVVYLVGSAFIAFFIQHDMQIIYLYEIVPANRRATIYGIVKGLANLSIIAVPLLRTVAMKNDPELWRNVFAVPVLACVVIAILIMLFAKETKMFLSQRINWLSKPYEERHPVKQEKKAKENKGKTGIAVGMKHLFKEKQLLFILITCCCFSLVTSCFYGFTESIMYDYGMKTEEITDALLFYPIIYALIIPACGFLSDRIGRKKVIIISGATAVMFHLPACIVGILYGLYLGSWWATVDFTSMMSSESVPTHNRGSVAGASSLVQVVAGGLGAVVTIVAPLLFQYIGFGYMVVTIPFVLIGLIVMALKVRETKGVDLSAVQYENS